MCNGWHTEVSLPDDMPKLTDDVAIALYWIAQESLANASKYARATTVSVVFDVGEEGVRLCVRDNGRGSPVDIERRRMAGHHDLLGIGQRAIVLGGTFVIGSVPGGGATIIVELPPSDIVPDRGMANEPSGIQVLIDGIAPVPGRGGVTV